MYYITDASQEQEANGKEEKVKKTLSKMKDPGYDNKCMRLGIQSSGKQRDKNRNMIR